MKKIRKNYSLEFKIRAVSLSEERGSVTVCEEFVSMVEKNINHSMSGKGNCYDNAVAESFFKTLKTELVYQNKYQTRESAKTSIFEYIEAFYNTQRR